MKSITPLLIASLVIAIAGAAQPAFIRWPDSAMAMHLRVFGPAVLWLMLVAAGLVGYGKRGRLLLGAPIALFGPVMWGVYVLGCTIGKDVCSRKGRPPQLSLVRPAALTQLRGRQCSGWRSKPKRSKSGRR